MCTYTIKISYLHFLFTFPTVNILFIYPSKSSLIYLNKPAAKNYAETMRFHKISTPGN